MFFIYLFCYLQRILKLIGFYCYVSKLSDKLMYLLILYFNNFCFVIYSKVFFVDFFLKFILSFCQLLKSRSLYIICFILCLLYLIFTFCQNICIKISLVQIIYRFVSFYLCIFKRIIFVQIISLRLIIFICTLYKCFYYFSLLLNLFFIIFANFSYF